MYLPLINNFVCNLKIYNMKKIALPQVTIIHFKVYYRFHNVILNIYINFSPRKN